MINSAASSRINEEVGLSSSNKWIRWLKLLPITSHLILFIRHQRANFHLRKELGIDRRRYSAHSSAVRVGDTKEKLHALVTMAYHSLEKGLSLRSPRPGFGQEHAKVLIERLSRYRRLFGDDRLTEVTFNVLESYRLFNAKHGFSFDWLNSILLERPIGKDPLPILCIEATRAQTKLDLPIGNCFDFEKFANSRHSVRQYSPEPVSKALLDKVFTLAQKTPCVCNRQSARVLVLTSHADIQDALKIQGGARGFETEVAALLIVSTELAEFQSVGERYQNWIDGGMYSMNLLYALHAVGLVSCCLNWSKNHDTDEAMHGRFSIPDSERIVLVISVGHPLDTFSVAASNRRPLDEQVRYYSSASQHPSS